MKWIKAKNGNVILAMDEFVDGLVEAGHLAFDTEDEARSAPEIAPEPEPEIDEGDESDEDSDPEPEPEPVAPKVRRPRTAKPKN